MYLLTNGRVLTMDEHNTVYANGAVAWQDGIIRAVGGMRELSALYPKAQTLDAKGGLVLPGFIDMHCHSWLSLLKGYPFSRPPVDYPDLVRNFYWQGEKKLTPADIRQGARSTAIDCIRHGVTTIFDHHPCGSILGGVLDLLALEYLGAGIRFCLALEVSDRNGEAKARIAIRENGRFARLAKKNHTGRVQAILGLGSSWDLSNATLLAAVEERGQDLGLHLHLRETREEQAACLRYHGASVGERLDKLGVFRQDTLAVGCSYLSEKELSLLKQKGVGVVHTPALNMEFAMPPAPVSSMLMQGITVGLGSNGLSQDMLALSQTAALLQHFVTQDPGVKGAAGLLFKGNPRLANRYFPLPLGVLKPGAAADLVVCAETPLQPMGHGDVLEMLRWGVTSGSVRHTIAAGKILMQDGELTGFDQKEEAQESRAQVQRFWRRLEM